jgi:hypothetical protein
MSILIILIAVLAILGFYTWGKILAIQNELRLLRMIIAYMIKNLQKERKVYGKTYSSHMIDDDFVRSSPSADELLKFYYMAERE